MLIAWTGHRPDLFRDPFAARERVLDTARGLLNEATVERFLVGGQRGVDTWAAEAAHLLGVRFTIVLPLPVPRFTADWTSEQRAELERTLSWAADVRIVDGDAELAYTERNRRLATEADLLVAVWTGREGGGTAETVAFARQFGTPVRELVLDAAPGGVVGKRARTLKSDPEVPLTDQDLLAACARGEQAAWNALVDRYAALIYSIPLKYGLAEQDAADVFQSVCIALLEHVGSIREPRGLAAWIITTTSRASWALRRQRSREISQSDDDEERVDPQPLPEDEILSLERQHLLRTALGQLDPRCRELIEGLFSDTEQSSYQALADKLGVPLNSLGPTRARCLAKLRQALEAAGYPL